MAEEQTHTAQEIEDILQMALEKCLVKTLGELGLGLSAELYDIALSPGHQENDNLNYHGLGHMRGVKILDYMCLAKVYTVVGATESLIILRDEYLYLHNCTKTVDDVVQIMENCDKAIETLKTLGLPRGLLYSKTKYEKGTNKRNFYPTNQLIIDVRNTEHGKRFGWVAGSELGSTDIDHFPTDLERTLTDVYPFHLDEQS